MNTEQVHAKAQAKPADVKARVAGARSTHATPLTYDLRAERYAWQNYARPLTARQMRRLAKKINRSFRAARESS